MFNSNKIIDKIWFLIIFIFNTMSNSYFPEKTSPATRSPMGQYTIGQMFDKTVDNLILMMMMMMLMMDDDDNDDDNDDDSDDDSDDDCNYLPLTPGSWWWSVSPGAWRSSA